MAKSDNTFLLVGLGALAFFLFQRAPVVLVPGQTPDTSTLLPEPEADLIVPAAQYTPVLKYDPKPIRDYQSPPIARYFDSERRRYLGPPQKATAGSEQ